MAWEGLAPLKQAHHLSCWGLATTQHVNNTCPACRNKILRLNGTVTGSSKMRHIRQAACCRQDIAKAGVGILGDAHKLQRDYGTACEGLWDIYQRLQDRADSPAGGRGLASALMPIFFQVVSPFGIRLGPT